MALNNIVVTRQSHIRSIWINIFDISLRSTLSRLIEKRKRQFRPLARFSVGLGRVRLDFAVRVLGIEFALALIVLRASPPNGKHWSFSEHPRETRFDFIELRILIL